MVDEATQAINRIMGRPRRLPRRFRAHVQERHPPLHPLSLLRHLLRHGFVVDGPLSPFLHQPLPFTVERFLLLGDKGGRGRTECAGSTVGRARWPCVPVSGTNTHCCILPQRRPYKPGSGCNGMLGGRRKPGLAVVALVGHLLTTLGFPVSALPPDKRGGDQPFPCQSRPCGCLTAEECWAGDCCCSTLEEKLVWAETNGIEPPPHVRPLVRARQNRQTPPKQKSCCSVSRPGEQSLSEEPTPSCCLKGAHTRPPVVCDADSPGTSPQSGSDAPLLAPSGVRWVAGVFAQKCRAEGPAGSFQLEPAVVTDFAPLRFDRPERVRHSAPRSDRVTLTSHCPPTPPPRPI